MLRVEPRKNRVFVEGLNMVKRHTKPHQVAGAHTEQRLGGVIEREGPIHISNVMLLDTKGNPTRVAIERVRRTPGAGREGDRRQAGVDGRWHPRKLHHPLV